MTGKLYGIGVGPGDPELLTLKAVRLLQACDVIAVPGKRKEATISYQIALQAVSQIAEKECLELEMPMTKEKEKLEKSHNIAFEKIKEKLEQKKNIAFLTLGDPCIYSTYIYIHQKIVKAGYPAEIVSGIPSFCAVSARLNEGLVEKSQMLHIIPSTYGIEEGMKFPGTKVLMKPAKQLEGIREYLQKKQNCQVSMIENCGMAKEHVYQGIEEIPEQTGYYSLMIIKEK